MHGVKCKFKCMEPSATCKCMESSASCKCKESSAVDLRGVQISSWGSGVAPTTLYENQPSARGRGAKTRGFFAILCWLARPSAGIGVVQVQKHKVFCDFVLARAALCGDWRGPGAKTQGFVAVLFWPARPSAGIGVVEVQKFRCFATSAWSRCKKKKVFGNFVLARATLCGDRRGRGAKTRGFLRLLLFELVLGSCLVVRAPAPGTGGSRV